MHRHSHILDHELPADTRQKCSPHQSAVSASSTCSAAFHIACGSKTMHGTYSRPLHEGHAKLLTAKLHVLPPLEYPLASRLDKGEGDGLTERVLQAAARDPGAALCSYRITTHTSDIKFAGTDADVAIEIFGTRQGWGAGRLGNIALCNSSRCQAYTTSARCVAHVRALGKQRAGSVPASLDKQLSRGVPKSSPCHASNSWRHSWSHAGSEES